ncbi:pilus assembly protein TadG-related protein [Roseovarius sp. MMSF_3281]|uniref:pilus assembly protein TadG-related protein n=1 Tax=Roseovarius sp. MMSF_3281 TaxID=3046694 RepID=UPI00273D1197|nr:pilus assembly protein TadG-related protein [Roseovarius sp. MMSF_3281]
MRIRPFLIRFRRDENGAVAVLVGLLLVVLIGFLAIGVDIGALYYQQKTLQTRADLAAVTAVMNLDDAPATAAESTVTENGLDAAALGDLSYAHYDRDSTLTPEARITARDLGDADVNAATTSLQKSAPLYFASTFLPTGSTTLSATATAARLDLASFTLGSRLLALDTTDSAVLNALLGTALGSPVSLDLVDYEALADTSIDLLTFTDALATRADLTALSYEEILNSNINLPDIAGALLDTGLVAGSTDVLTTVLNSGATSLLNASDLIALDGDNADLWLDDVLPTIEVTALDLLVASVDIINEDALIDIGVGIPGLASASVVVGERPVGSGWIIIGERDTTLHTAQVRLKLRVALNLVGLASVDLPLYLEIAGATATLTRANACGTPDPSDVVAVFDTGSDAMAGGHGNQVAKLYIGDLVGKSFEDTSTYFTANDFEPVKLVDVLGLLGVPIARVDIKAYSSVGATPTESTEFTYDEIGETKTYGSGTLLTTALSTLLAPQDNPGMEGAHIDVTVLGLGLGSITDLLLTLVYPILDALLSPLDVLVDRLLSALGIGIGEADLTLNGVSCGGVMLVR